MTEPQDAKDAGQPGGGEITSMIAKLERATKPDRGLDWAIHGAPPPPQPAYDWANVPLYTASLDAALTLVPEGMACDLHIGPGAIYSQATVWQPVKYIDEQGRRCTRYEGYHANEPQDGKIQRNTPPLALCIAALKARQNSLPQPDPVSPGLGVEHR